MFLVSSYLIPFVICTGVCCYYDLYTFQPSLPASDLAALLLQYRDETLPDTANQTDSGTEFTTTV